jgi:hypothetical protein
MSIGGETRPSSFRDEVMLLLRYDPESGRFFWRVSRGPCAAGEVAGTDKDGYVQINVLGRLCKAHRLAWLFQTGDWPPKGFVLDHQDRNRANNRWANLRLADVSQNNTNSTIRADNTSGCTGVYRQGNAPGWQARVFKGGRGIHLGYFATKEEAVVARLQAANLIYGAFSPHQEQAA